MSNHGDRLRSPISYQRRTNALAHIGRVEPLAFASLIESITYHHLVCAVIAMVRRGLKQIVKE